MKSKLNSAFNAPVHHLNIDPAYPSDELIDENFIRGDKDNSFLSSDSYNSGNFLLAGQPPQLHESDLIDVNKTLKLINNSQLLKCLNRTMLNDETSSSPLDEQLSQTSNASSANAELSAASKAYQLDLVPISSPGDQSGQQLAISSYYQEHSVESPENNSSGEWNNGAQQDPDYEPQPKHRRTTQTRQSTAQLVGSHNSGSVQNLADQFSGQLSPLQQLVLAQQQLNALRGQQQQQQQNSAAAALTSQLVSQLSNTLTKDSSDPDAMSANAVALSSLLNGSMNFNQLSQHLNQLNQLSQLGLSGSSSLNSSPLTSLLHNMVSNQSSVSSQQPSPSVVSQSNQPSSAFNISLNCNTSSSNIVLNSNLTVNESNSLNLPFLVANNGSAAVSASNQPTNSVSSQSLDSSKKPFDICIVCGDKASGGFLLSFSLLCRAWHHLAVLFLNSSICN